MIDQEPIYRDVALLPHQLDFVCSNNIHTGLVAGYGSGKSWAGTVKVVEFLKSYPGIPAAYYLPTYKLVKKIAFTNFEKYLGLQGIPYTLNRSDYIFTTPLGEIHLGSTNNPEAIVGFEVGYSLVDESDVPPMDKMKDSAKNIAARNRLPLPDGSPNCLDFVSTPEGFQFMYKFFIKDNKANRTLIRAKTTDNPFLSDSYIDTLLDMYTEEQVEAYINGEFVNLGTGNVYRNFDRTRNHTDRQITSGSVLHIGMDFNVGNMSAVIHEIEGKNAYALAEITGALDTPDMINIIKERFPGHSIVVYPDASGDNRNTTNSNETDHKLLRKAGFKVKSPKKNPPVRDRINLVNGGFLNAKGEVSYWVNTFNCPEYTEALEQLPYKKSKDGGTQYGIPDKTAGYDHITDAGGYFIYTFRNRKRTTTINAG